MELETVSHIATDIQVALLGKEREDWKHMQSVTEARCAEAERSASQLRDENQALRQKLILLQQEVCIGT